MKLTLVVPCFNEEESVIEFYSEVTRVFKDKVEDYELVFVNDGSRDKTPQILRAIYEKADNVKVVNFSRNFGKEAAIYAGLKQSSGDYTCVIDADLQQRPEVVLEMKQILDENADIDCVAAYQGERKESKLLIFFKDKFYEVINKLSDVELYPGASDFRLCAVRCLTPFSICRNTAASQRVFSPLSAITQSIFPMRCRRGRQVRQNGRS